MIDKKGDEENLVIAWLVEDKKKNGSEFNCIFLTISRTSP